MKPTDPCPCGRTDGKGRVRAFGQCCGPLLAGAPAPDAESLMRSRYTAFVLLDGEYLWRTWHPDHRPDVPELEAPTKWLGLDVREHRVIDPDHAEVEFVARFRAGGRGGRIHERSRFERGADGRWVYVDGEMR